MTVQAVTQFLRKVSEDEKLQEELAKVLETKDNDRVAATALGAKHGYQFTPDELWQEIQNRESEFQQSQKEGELSDQELETVSGGTYTPTIIGAVSLIGAATVNAKW